MDSKFPPCYAKLHDPRNGLCQTCAVFLKCGLARMQTFLFEGPMPTERTPAARPNTYPPGTCKWVAWEAANRLDGIFTEADILVAYYAVCRSCKIRPLRAARTIRDVVTELVKAGVLTRVGSKKIRHAMIEG